MKYLFGDPKNVDLLRAEVKSWDGTPYWHHDGKKGMGCDCIHFVVRILEVFGIGPIKVPEYPKDWHLHRNEELLITGFDKEVPCEPVNCYSPVNGDVLFFKFGRTLSHAGIYCDGRVWQSLALNNTGVKEMAYKDPKLYNRLKEARRILYP